MVLPLARKFHELNQAYELLLDPLRRLALDAKLRVKQARTERFKDADAKRKNLLDELEERERAFKKARTDKQKEEVAIQQHNERIQEEGKRLREEREKVMKMKIEMEEKQAETLSLDADSPPEMGKFHGFECLLLLSLLLWCQIPWIPRSGLDTP